MPFAFGDQSRDCGTVGSRPAGRRWRLIGNNFLFAGSRPAGLTVQGSPLHPSSKTFFDGWHEESPRLRERKVLPRLRVPRMRERKVLPRLRVPRMRERKVLNQKQKHMFNDYLKSPDGVQIWFCCSAVRVGRGLEHCNRSVQDCPK